MKNSLAVGIAYFPLLVHAEIPKILPSKSTFTFPYSMPGVSVVVEKSYDPVTFVPRLSSNSPYIQSGDDLVKLEQQEDIQRNKKYGAIVDDALVKKYKALKAGEKINVVVALKEPEGIEYLDKTKNSSKALEVQALSLASIQPVVGIPEFLQRHGLKIKKLRSKRSFQVEVTPTELEKLQFDENVASVDEWVPSQPVAFPNPQLGTLARSAYWHANVIIPASAGQGINAATYESGIDPTVMACWGGLNGAQIDQNIQPWPHWEHSQQTFRCLMNAAPGANLFHRLSGTFDGVGDDTYIINNNIRSVSMSYANPGVDTKNEFRVMDDFAYRSPFPVFNNPTANAGYSMQSDWQCFNALSVGNVRHTNQNHWELVDTTNAAGGCTQTTNPVAKYGSARDREMPMIVAPGITPSTTYNMDETCVSNSAIYCGTSYSAPTTSGISTDVIAADSRIIGWPEKVRVVLLATAQNVDRGYWSASSDGRDGAGVIHGAGAIAFAQGHTLVYPNNSAVVDGIGASSISASDFASPNSPIVYKIQIPNPKPSGKHLRVVLTWDSNPVLNSATNALSDLDLLVTSGSGGMASQSSNSNVEMVDIPSTMFTAGSIVDARITKWVNRIPSGGRASFFYYSIGWTWVKDHAD